jgi:ubiquinone/menaquinone biosynthesis C-methylase UbiE
VNKMNNELFRISSSMRKDWDDRARKDAYYYIASWKKDWDEQSFLRSGEDDYLRLVQPALDRNNFLTADKSMLELGCGAGRMTGSLAQRFARVIAFDVSPAMLERARLLHRDVPGITWVLGNGTDLSPVPSASVDFVFSYLVLQHLPEAQLVHVYIAEILRVLKKDGLCLLQFNGSSDHNMNWKGRTVWGIVDLLWTVRLHTISRCVAALLGLDPQMGGKSWHGAPVPFEEIAKTICNSGALVLEDAGRGTPMAWCCAKKVLEL